ncbi:virulence factor TspB C-terminal domain-related protein [Pseudomonas kribbensis]|uniref:Attachment protein n=1 Tax=Pseudomonas kribbensis TaxID=1628086 RepID=A0A4Y8V8X3_9PSED|nr:virulence factor TspB C-terminal domain-related protein [Pseudomonas kribbensis]TFH76244.1 hypothetical protein E4J90_29305 [Pseudomonas kribbensis]
MGLLTRVKTAVLFGCLLFASHSFAEDYYWTWDGVSKYPTPDAACDSGGRGQYAQSTTQIYDHSDPPEIYNDGRSANCQLYYTDPSGASGPAPIKGVRVSIGRGGNACPAGTDPFNPVTGTCNIQPHLQPGEKCPDQTGGTASNPMIFDDTVNKCVNFASSEGDAPCSYMKGIADANPANTGTAYEVAGTVTGGVASAPPTFAMDGLKCIVATVSTSSCKVGIDGTATCSVIGKLTGKGSSTGTKLVDALCPNGTCDPQEPEVKTQDQPCVPTGTGGGGSSCTATKETKQDGSQQCGTVNGAYKCITKQPYSNGITTNITATSETLSDGSVKVTTVKDSTNKVCTDVNTCTTQTSTTTSHTTTKPNGTTTTDSSCKGTCNNNGGGLETNTGAGTGKPTTGTGNGGNGDGEGGDGTASTTDDCAAPPPCDGDPFLCAILKQQHIDTCKMMADATAEQKAAAKAKTDAAYADLDAHQAQMDQQVNSLLGQFQASTGGTGSAGKCLPDKQISFGHFSAINLEFSKACDSISWVRLVLLAGAYLFAARIVSKEV